MKTQRISLVNSRFIGYYNRLSSDSDVALIVLSESNGGLVLSQYAAQQFAREGIPSLAVAYFKYPNLSNTLSLIPLEYMGMQSLG